MSAQYAKLSTANDAGPSSERAGRPSIGIERDDDPLLDTPTTERQGTASMFSCISNLCNTILGTGMLAMPHAVSSGGLIPGSFTIAFCGMMAALGLLLLARCAPRAGHRNSSFFSLSQLSLPKASAVFDAAIALKCGGVAISYLIIIGSLMPKVIVSFEPKDAELPPYLLDRRTWITASMIILVPIAFFRSLHALRFTSYIALVAVADLIIVVVYKFFDRSGLAEPGEVDLARISNDLVSSLPVYVFAFTCSQNFHPVFNELVDNSQRRLTAIIGISIGGAAGIYEVVGLLGYMTFGNNVSANIMAMYSSSAMVNICRLGIVVLVLFSYPLQLHPCRASVDSVFSREPQFDAKRPTTDIPQTRFVFITCSILIVTYSIAMSVSSLDKVLGFVGSTGSTIISFILPALFYTKIFSTDETRGFDRILRYLAWFLLVFGILVMIFCLGLNVVRAVR